MKIILEKIYVDKAGLSANKVTDEQASQYDGTGIIVNEADYVGVNSDAADIVDGVLLPEANTEFINSEKKKELKVDYYNNLELITTTVGTKVFETPFSSESAYKASIKHFLTKAAEQFPEGDGTLINWTLKTGREPVTKSELEAALEGGELQALTLGNTYHDQKSSL